MSRGRPRKYFTAIDLFLAKHIRDELGMPNFDLSEVKAQLGNMDSSMWLKLGYGPGNWLPSVGENGWEIVWNT